MELAKIITAVTCKTFALVILTHEDFKQKFVTAAKLFRKRKHVI